MFQYFDEARVIGLNAFVHYGIAGAGLQGLQGKGVAVEVLPFQGHEKLVFPDGPGIGIHSRRLQEDLV